jgi:PBP1b-binding outer membrane lipoprotein LpoB
MNISQAIVSSLLALLLVAVGCSKEVPAPEAIAVEDASAALQQAPTTPQSSPEVQAMLSDAIAKLNARDYSNALFILQALSGRADLTPEQQSVVSRSMLAVNKALSEQAAAGNAQAQQAMQIYRANK